MDSQTLKPVLATFTVFLFTLMFQPAAGAETITATQVSQTESPHAGLMDTDSKGSYSHGAEKREGSGSKMMPPVKREGSGSKSYPEKKREGSGSQSYSHKKDYRHGKSFGHGYSPHGKSHKPHGYRSRGHKTGHGRFFHSGTDPFHHVLRFKHKLGLTKDQIQKIREEALTYEKIKIQAHADMRIAHLELDELVHSSTVNEEKILNTAKAIAAVQTRLTTAMAEAKIELLRVLTPEQRQKVSEMHSEHH